MATPIIDIQAPYVWQNWHSSQGVGGSCAKFYTPRNLWSDGSVTPGKGFAPGLAALQQIVQQAERDHMRVRAIGSSWSLSSIAYVEDYMIDTSRLSSWFVGFRTPALVEPQVRDESNRLVFAQCGTAVKTLNTYLEANGLALPTSGGGNGQTIAGAISTGTHGSAHQVGAMQDYILGLHVVGEGGQHYWIERPSKPTMTPDFAAWLGATHVRDEDLFLSALVGFGSFGLIHAVLFKAEPLYYLDLFIQRYDFEEVLVPACTLNIGSLGLPWGDTLPFHFEVVINPYLRGRGQKGVFVRALQKRAATGPTPQPQPTENSGLMSSDLVSLAGHLSDSVPAVVPQLLQSLLEGSMPITAPGTISRTPGIHFGDTQPDGGGTSVELGIPFDRLAETLNLIFSVTDNHIFGAPLSLRYVKASDALLAFTCHAPLTVAIELPGVDSSRAREAHGLIYEALRTARIPVTYHWGQQSPFTYDSIVAGYGQERVDRWLRARQGFLTSDGRRMFSNSILDGCRLST